MLREARMRRKITTDGLTLPVPSSDLYINERLTKTNRTLFLRARIMAKDHNFQFVWTREGKIFVRQEQGGQRQRIQAESDLGRVFGKNMVSS